MIVLCMKVCVNTAYYSLIVIQYEPSSSKSMRLLLSYSPNLRHSDCAMRPKFTRITIRKYEGMSV